MKIPAVKKQKVEKTDIQVSKVKQEKLKQGKRNKTLPMLSLHELFKQEYTDALVAIAGEHAMTIMTTRFNEETHTANRTH